MATKKTTGKKRPASKPPAKKPAAKRPVAKNPPTGKSTAKPRPAARKAVSPAARPEPPRAAAPDSGVPARVGTLESAIAGLRQRLRASPVKVHAHGKVRTAKAAERLDAVLERLAGRYRDILD